MHTWDLLTKGKYSPTERYIALDYRKLFLDQHVADITLAHEASHYVMGESSEFGQATRTIATVLAQMTHLGSEDKERIQKSLYNDQLFVQEGFATCMEIERLKSIRGKSAALKWAEEHLNRDHGYWDRFVELSFTHNLSKKYRDLFVEKISSISLETSIRKFGWQNDILSSAEAFEAHLSDPQNNPDERLRCLLTVIKNRPWLLTKTREEISRNCGLQYNEASTKHDVAKFVTYLWSKTETPHTITPEMIGDTPSGEQLFLNALDSLRITNLNFDFQGTGVQLYSKDDFAFYADVTEAVFYTEAGQHFITPELTQIIGDDPDVALAAFRKGDRAKYLTANSKKNATLLLNGPFSKCTQIVKHLGFDISTNQAKLSPGVQPPNIVIYDRPQDMSKVIAEALQKNPRLRFKFRHIGASEGHQFQMLWVLVDGQEPIHALTHFGSTGISLITSQISEVATLLTDEEILERKKRLNNLLVVGMDMPWEADWIASMVDGKRMYYRS